MKTKFFIILLVLIISGCISTKKDQVWNLDNTPSMHPYQVKALKYEKNDDLQLALANWRIAEKLLFDKINSITANIENNAEMHFQKGVTLYNAGINEQAKKEFLRALRYDRDHEGALVYLKNWYRSSIIITYTVKKGDTFKKIANNVYNNYNNDYIVKYFSELNNNEALKAGAVINLPVLNIELTKLFFNYQKEIEAARKLFHGRDFENLLIAAENILKHNPSNKEALFMINTACYKLGEKFFREGKYQKSIDFFKRVDSDFRNVKNDITEAIAAFSKMKNDATENENYRCYYKGLELYRNKKYIEALKYLDKVESGYETVNDVKLKIQSSMKKESELHYKNGVKYFVNEKLTLAINEWEKALLLNPEKKMIERDIENAMNLLEKIKKID